MYAGRLADEDDDDDAGTTSVILTFALAGLDPCDAVEGSVEPPPPPQAANSPATQRVATLDDKALALVDKVFMGIPPKIRRCRSWCSARCRRRCRREIGRWDRRRRPRRRS